METTQSPSQDNLGASRNRAAIEAAVLILAPVLQSTLIASTLEHPSMLWDYLCPFFLAAFTLNFILQRKKNFRLRIRTKALMLNLLFLGLFFWTSETALGIAAIATAFFLLLPPGFYISHPERRLVLPALCLGASTVIARTVFKFLWRPITRTTALIVFGALKLAHLPVHAVPVTNGRMVIEHPKLGMLIEGGCGGLEGIFFFLFSFTFLYLLKPRIFDRKQWGGFLLLGITYLYCLNFFRLILVFCLWISMPKNSATPLVFHDSIGWILYSVGTYAYFRWIFLQAKAESAIAQKGSQTQTASLSTTFQPR